MCEVDSNCLVTDRVGCHTAVCIFILILDLQSEAEVEGGVWVAGLVDFLLSSVPG